jgi:phage baseplate assembly protein W
MNPNYGCLIWDRLFEPLTPALKDAMVKDVTEIIQADPRIDVLQRVQLSQSTDGIGILLSADIIIKNTNELVNLNLAFDGTSGVVNTTVNY